MTIAAIFLDYLKNKINTIFIKTHLNLLYL